MCCIMYFLQFFPYVKDIIDTLSTHFVYMHFIAKGCSTKTQFSLEIQNVVLCMEISGIGILNSFYLGM